VLLELVDRGIIRILDIAFLAKDEEFAAQKVRILGSGVRTRSPSRP
jgi:hypothetical protein